MASLLLKRFVLTLATSFAFAHVAQAESPPMFLKRWGSGLGGFGDATGIAIDASGQLRTSDYTGHRVETFLRDGTYCCFFPVGAASAVACDLSGNIYIVDEPRCKIQKFSSSGALLVEWGTRGQGNGQFNDPARVAVDASGNIYVTDSGLSQVVKFAPDTTFIMRWGSRGSGDGQFVNPIGIDVDPAGNVFVADYANYRIEKFTSEGVFLAKWGSHGTGDGQFLILQGIGVDPQGNVYATDIDANNVGIQKFTGDGVFLTRWGTFGGAPGQMTDPDDVALDATGNVYVMDGQWVEKFGPAPVATEPTSWGKLKATYR